MAVTVKKQTEKKKRVSKKKKSAWRKHCDTKDVDEFLDEIRHEERVGIKFSEANDDQLFFEDVDSSKKPKEEDATNIRKKKQENAVPRCFQILLPHTAVPDPILKRNRVRTPEERKHPFRRQKEAKRKAEGILTAKEKSVIQNRIFQAEKDKNKPKRGEFKFDVWAETDEKTPEEDTEWLKPVTLRHTLINTRQFKKIVPKTVQRKTSVLPAIERPHPGLSYNPAYADHQSLLRQVADEELVLEKKERRLHRLTTKMFSRVTAEQNEVAWLSEMSEGLQKVDDNVEIKEEDPYPNEYKAINPPVKNRKKTRAQRNRQLRARMEEKKRKLAAVEKKKVSDIYRLKKISKNLEEKELKSLKKQAALNRKKALMEFEAKRLSREKFKPADKEFILPSELSGDLRSMKTDGNPLNDRFKSLQKRNILPATVKHNPPKKAKQKKFIKSAHRITDEDVMRNCKV